MAESRAIVVVTEGATVTLLEDWCEQGLLPGFAHLFREGASGCMSSTFVPYEAPGLTTAFTGRTPGDHGWFSYWRVHERGYRPRPLTSADVAAPFLWQRPELAGKRFAVINMFGTHPPAPLNGWLISYPTLQTLRACYPSNLLWSLARQGLPYTHDVSVWFAGQEREMFVREVLEADRRRGNVAVDLWNQGADAVVLNLTAIDRLSHCYWQELEPGSPISMEDSAIFKAYRCSDRILQQLVGCLTDDSSLLAFSEIGFGPLRAFCSINRYLSENGLLSWENGPEKSGIRWNQTVAFEAIQGTHGVNINVKDRYREGIVDFAEYDHRRDQVMDLLRTQMNSFTGLPLFREVFPREAVYKGELVSEAPDIIVEPADERYLPLGEPYWAQHVQRVLQSGWHRRNSYWAGIGAHFKHGVGRSMGSLPDIASTVFGMLNLKIPEDLLGTPLGKDSADENLSESSMS